MLTEVLVYVPTVANFRPLLAERSAAAARTAALVASPNSKVTDELKREILDSVGARGGHEDG